MQFSENQKYYLKRFAALHMPEIGRKAAYVRQELKTTWMAVDSTSVPDGVVYVYHNKEYKHIEDIVADVLDIHGDSAKIMQINNSRLACELPTFVTWEKAETLYTIPGDKEKREIVTCINLPSEQLFLVFCRGVSPTKKTPIDSNNVYTGAITNAICRVLQHGDGWDMMSFLYTAIPTEYDPYLEVILCSKADLFHWL